MFFAGFTLDETGPVRFRHGGSGPPLLLLHGHPQTHAMWHAVAPLLAERCSVICPDLSPFQDEAALSDAMLGLMTQLGHDRFGVAGHDFGAHVACHMALEAPARIARLAALEIVPVPEHLNRADMAYSLAAYRNCWFGQLHPKPEALITHAPSDWFSADLPADGQAFFHPEAVADYRLAASARNRQPEQGETEPSRAKTPQTAEAGHRLRLSCPVLVIWGSKGRIGGWYDPLLLWAECVDNTVSGGAVPAGHFLAEESAETIVAAFETFFTEGRAAAEHRRL